MLPQNNINVSGKYFTGLHGRSFVFLTDWHCNSHKDLYMRAVCAGSILCMTTYLPKKDNSKECLVFF